MKKPSLLLSLGSLLALPLPAMAAMTEMADSELADVSGQAYVVEFGRFEHTIPDLTERNVAIGPIAVSDAARSIEAGLSQSDRSGPPRGGNWHKFCTRRQVSWPWSAAWQPCRVSAPLLPPYLSLLPTPKISYKISIG